MTEAEAKHRVGGKERVSCHSGWKGLTSGATSDRSGLESVGEGQRGRRAGGILAQVWLRALLARRTWAVSEQRLARNWPTGALRKWPPDGSREWGEDAGRVPGAADLPLSGGNVAGPTFQISGGADSANSLSRREMKTAQYFFFLRGER